MNNYSVSQTVIDSIEVECRRNPENETGGILVGVRTESRSFVTHCSGPGVIWSSSTHHFTKDTEYSQEVLNFLYEYFGVNYLGLWHKHPVDYPRPSDGDVANAMTEIADLNIGLKELLTPVCFLTDNRVSISPFVVRGGYAHSIDWDVVTDRHLTDIGILNGNWYDATIGQDRLRDEVTRLENLKLSVSIRKGDDGRCRVRATSKGKKSWELVFLCPDDYPVSAPHIAILDKRTGSYLPVASQHINDWNLYKYMSDLAAELDFG